MLGAGAGAGVETGCRLAVETGCRRWCWRCELAARGGDGVAVLGAGGAGAVSWVPALVLVAGCARGGDRVPGAGRWLCAWWRGFFVLQTAMGFLLFQTTMSWLRALSRQGAGTAGCGAGAGRCELAACVVETKCRRWALAVRVDSGRRRRCCEQAVRVVETGRRCWALAARVVETGCRQ